MIKQEIEQYSGATLLGASGLSIATTAPVVYTSSAGGGDGEYQAPVGGETISIPSNIPTGSTPVFTWWIPLQGMESLAGFNVIGVSLDPGDSSKIQLSLRANKDAYGRMRILIFTVYQ
jgi:hypothetical protein